MKKKIIKIGLIVFTVGLLAALGIAYYMFNMPHRDVQASKVDFSLQASSLVAEYLKDADAANEKYLDEEGESKILAVTGIIASITEDLNHQKVVLLKTDTDKAGISCTFLPQTSANTATLKVGETTSIKGVIRSGAQYDEDLELYENVILEKCDIIK